MRLVDLTRRLDPTDLERLPPPARLAASVLVPEVESIAPAGRGAEIMGALFGCGREHLPDGEGGGDEMLRFSSHLGTHVDAPLHFGSTCEGRPARGIDENGAQIGPGTAVLLRTGRERFRIDEHGFFQLVCRP